MEKKKSSMGILGGIFLIIIGIILLWWNEGRAVKTIQMISEAKEEYIDVGSDKINKKYNNKLIATTGTLETTGTQDETFNIKTPGAKLERIVEMYQWKEKCTTNNNDVKKCTYKKVWSIDIINSDNFYDTSYSNPDRMPYESKEFYDSSATIGKFHLNRNLLSQLSTNEEVETLEENIATQHNMTIESDKYYTSVKNNTPEIGDVRISFSYNNSGTVSVMAVQNEEELSPFIASNGYKLYELREGTMNGETMLSFLTEENNTLKWMLRGIGVLLIIVGFAATIAPLQHIASYIPFFGTIFGWVSGVISIALGLGVSLLVIAIAWFRYRPILSISLILIAAIAIILAKKITKRKKVNKIPAQ